MKSKKDGLIMYKMKRIFEQYGKELLIIIILFTLARGLMLFNNGVYWDDWTVFNVGDKAVVNTFIERGTPLKGFIHILFNNYPIAYRSISFVSLLASSLLLFFILTTISQIDAADRLIIVLLFSLFPSNFAIISTNIAPHLFCLFLFALGSFFLLKYILEGKWISCFVSLILFFISFQYEAFLVFYSVPFLLIVYHEKIYTKLPNNLVRLKKYVFFILAPFIYWIIRQTFLQPYGVHAYLNKIRIHYLLLSPLKAVWSMYNNLILPVVSPFDNELNGTRFFLVLLPIVICLYNVIKYRIRQDDKTARTMFVLGLFSYFMAVLSYIAIGRSGSNYGAGWLSRDQIIVPFSAAFIFLYGAKITFNELKINRKIMALCLSLLIVISIVSNIVNCLNFQRSWFARLSLINAFKKSDIVRYHSTFLIDDQTEYLKVLKEPFRFYEFAGMMKYAFGDETRLAVNYSYAKDNKFLEDDIKNYKEVSRYPQYNITNYIYKDPEYLITIKPNDTKLSLPVTLKILLLKLFNKNKYQERVNNILAIECIPLNDSVSSNPADKGISQTLRKVDYRKKIIK